MGHLLKAESTLTDRYQTTIPELVRRSLRISKRDKIVYTVGEDGSVGLSRSDESDPVLGEFLSFIATDIKNNPTHIKTISPTLLERARNLVAGMTLDLDEALSDEND